MEKTKKLSSFLIKGGEKVRVYIKDGKIHFKCKKEYSEVTLKLVKSYSANLKYVFLWFLRNRCCDTSELVLEIPEPFQLPCPAIMRCLHCGKEEEIEIKREELAEQEKERISDAFYIVANSLRYQKPIKAFSSVFGIPEDRLNVVGVAPSGQKENIQLLESGGIQKKLGQVIFVLGAVTTSGELCP